MREPLNPYERYEIHGMTDYELRAEKERETAGEAEGSNYLLIRHTEPKTVDEIVEEWESIING